MSNSVYTTTVNISNSPNSIKYLFVSKGKKDIIKAIDYAYLQDLNGRPVFNLGFGDYDFDKGTIDDSSHSDNEDVYKVFNTVLTSIPEFFKIHSTAIMMVEGSDSKPEFLKKCKLTCNKKCIDVDNCKNKHRRINVYRGYVNKNYDDLTKEYVFYGGIISEGVREIEPYMPQREYDSVFVIKKEQL